MPHHDLSARLRELSTSPEHRSQTARLRDVFNDVELAINAGVALEHILSELHQDGFTFGMPGFKSALQRIRAGSRTQRTTATPPAAAANTLAQRHPAPAPLVPVSPVATTGDTARRTMEQLTAENPGLSKKAVLDLFARQFSGTQNAVSQKFGTR